MRSAANLVAWGAVALLAALASINGPTLMALARLAAEVRQARALADKAEASRIELMQQFIGAEFRALRERLDTGSSRPVLVPTAAVEHSPRRSLMQIVSRGERSA